MTPERRPRRTGRGAPADPPSPSEPSAEGAGRSAELAALIRAEIESSPDGRITFARYMERALYEPDLGYYRAAADRPTDAGDFLTAPETHPIFGWTVARRIEAMWAELGRPPVFHLVEFGAGSGTLGLSILDGLRRRGSIGLLSAIRYEPVESNPNRLADLRDRFEMAGHLERLEPAGCPAIGSVPVDGVILANEFLDALPVHRVVVNDGKLRELFVTWNSGGGAGGGPVGGGFTELAAPPSSADLAARLADDGVEPAEGQVAEICLELDPWLGQVAARLARGFVLAIDYGYEPPSCTGLAAWRARCSGIAAIAWRRIRSRRRA